MPRGLGWCMGLALVALLVPAAARAADTEGTELHLTQQASRTMAPDRIRISLRIEASGSDPRALQAEINRRMAAALAKAKEAAGVTAETGAYTVYPLDGKDRGRWRADQTLALSSADFGAALALAGDLQAAGSLMSGMQFSLAPETLASVEDGLTAAALASLRRRADAVAKELGTTVDHYKSIAVGNVAEPFPVRRAFLAATAAPAAAPPPVAEPGDQTVSLSVNADIILAPPQK